VRVRRDERAAAVLSPPGSPEPDEEADAPPAHEEGPAAPGLTYPEREPAARARLRVNSQETPGYWVDPPGQPDAPPEPEPAPQGRVTPPEREPAALPPVSAGYRADPLPPASSTPTAAGPPVPPGLLPLLWFNQAFDAVLALAGPPGRFLCGRVGRHLLGALGALSLAGAFGLVVAHWLGWTW
jgi:hypothetical protein